MWYELETPKGENREEISDLVAEIAQSTMDSLEDFLFKKMELPGSQNFQEARFRLFRPLEELRGRASPESIRRLYDEIDKLADDYQTEQSIVLDAKDKFRRKSRGNIKLIGAIAGTLTLVAIASSGIVPEYSTHGIKLQGLVPITAGASISLVIYYFGGRWNLSDNIFRRNPVTDGLPKEYHERYNLFRNVALERIVNAYNSAGT